MPVEADKSASAGAPETEIEVTPEMVEAGCEAMRAAGYGAYKAWASLTEEDAAVMLTAIYRAMSRRVVLTV